MIYGVFNHKAILQEKQKVSNGRGGWSERWETIKAVYVNIQPMRTSEVLEYRKNQIKADTKIYMKYDPSFEIHTNCQFLFNNKACDIEVINNPLNKNQNIEIIATGVDL